MPAVQTSYADVHANGYAGQVADMGLQDVISRDVEDAAGIAFGMPVIQGTADRQCKVATAGVFLGITIRDTTLDQRNADKYVQRASAAILTRGVIWVVAGEAVVAGDVVYRTAAGALNKTSSSNTLVANARWETSAANGALAKLRLF